MGESVEMRNREGGAASAETGRGASPKSRMGRWKRRGLRAGVKGGRRCVRVCVCMRRM